jgi:hypothetical protein
MLEISKNIKRELPEEYIEEDDDNNVTIIEIYVKAGIDGVIDLIKI